MKSVEIVLLSEHAKIPTRGSEYAAGYDLYACMPKGQYGSVTIKPHETVKISTGVACKLPPYTFGGIYARSGLSTKQGLRPANCTGVIDEDYTGPIIVALHNDSDTTRVVYHGDRIAQLIVQEYQRVEFHAVDALEETERGDGGFGHTGN